MTNTAIPTQQEVIQILDSAGKAIYTYLKFIIIGLLIGMTAKTVAKNLLTRTRMLLSGLHGCRKDDMIQEPPYSGTYYIVEEISWWNGKVTLGNPKDPTDVIYRDLQSYWSHTIHGTRPSNLSINKGRRR